MTTWDCKATLISQGVASDDLLRFLDTLYLTNLRPTHMVASLELGGFSPWKNPGAFEDGGAKFLLLFPTGFEFDQGTGVSNRALIQGQFFTPGRITMTQHNDYVGRFWADRLDGLAADPVSRTLADCNARICGDTAGASS